MSRLVRDDTAALRRARFLRHDASGGPATQEMRSVPEETPVAIEVDGIAICVMIMTPQDLEDFAIGFARVEGLIDGVDDLRDIEVHALETGKLVRLRLVGPARERVFQRARTRLTEGACGLCGLSSLEAALEPLPRRKACVDIAPSAVWAALDALPRHQTVGNATRATHAAALCDDMGKVVFVREDIGRHCALDKLVGAAMRGGIDTSTHFALVTSRLSFEMVEKAARAPFAAIAAISAPSALALSRAREAGLPVFVLARSDSVLTSEG